MSTWTPAPNMPGFIPGIPVYPSDTVCKALVYSLEQPVQPRRGIIRRALGQPGVGTGYWPIVLICLLSIFALASLVTGWYSNDFDTWMWFWISAVTAVLIQFLLLLGVWYVRREQKRRPGGVDGRMRISVRTLRRAALAGDGELAPPVAVDDEHRTTSLTDMDNTTFAVQPLRSRLQRGERILWGIGAGWLIINVVVLFVSYSSSVRAIEWQSVVFFSLLVALYLSQFIVATLKSRAFQVEVREDGLYWRKHSLPWSQVRGWYVLALSPVNTGNPLPNIIYVLIGQHASLTWLTYPQFVRTGEPGEQLAELIQRHVSLPLRDLTSSAIRLSTEVARRSSWRRSRLLAIGDRYVAGVAMPRLPAAVLTFVLALLVLLAGILTPYGQQWYFGRDLARLQRAPAAMHDPLTANTLHWAPATTYDAAERFVFTSGGYMVSGDVCCDLSSLIMQPVSNGLVEVTIHEQSKYLYSDTGIVFHADSRSHTALAFAVDLRGHWQLYRFAMGEDGKLSHERYLRSGSIGGWGRQPIHQGHDATNRLAVLMRGSSYSFFVNGRYLGGYVATDLPQSGQVGVYVGLAHGPVTFSDLLISPA